MRLHIVVVFNALTGLRRFSKTYSVVNNSISDRVPNTPVLGSLIIVSLDCLVCLPLESAVSASPSS